MNGDGVVDVADIAAIIEIMKNNGGTGTEHKNNCYIGASSKLTYTLSEFNQYIATKPEIFELPVGTRYDVSVWIYPESWGKPTKANPIIDGSVMEDKNEIDMFVYDENLQLPEGYTGCYVALDSATTYKLTW